MSVQVLEQSRAPAPAGWGLDRLVDAIELLARANTVEDIASIVRTAARGLTGADGIAVVVRDEDRCHYLDEDAIGPLWKGRKFPLTACISGWSMLNRQTVVIPDIYADARIPHDAYRPTFVKSLVMTPVGMGEPVAAIGAYWGEYRTASADEVNMLNALARATATAFENVRLTASLKESIERRDFLIRELDHRVKNTLASVQAIAQQTAKTAADKDEFLAVFNPRLMALSRAHAMLTRESWKSARLSVVAAEAIAPFPSLIGRIRADGPAVVLGPVQAVAAQLAIHELITNALKHGALSVPEGEARLVWNVDMGAAERSLRINWTEHGGPIVRPPTRRSMGMRLIEDGLPKSLGGVAKTEFNPDGFCLQIDAPLNSMVQLG